MTTWGGKRICGHSKSPSYFSSGGYLVDPASNQHGKVHRRDSSVVGGTYTSFRDTEKTKSSEQAEVKQKKHSVLGKPRLLALVFDEKYLSRHVRHVSTVGNEETNDDDWNDINVFFFFVTKMLLNIMSVVTQITPSVRT